MKADERIVVVGGGLAALRAAERFRELGFAGELTIVGAERYRPYHRPALSKQILSGELRLRDLGLESYVELDATWRFGTPALRVDPARHVVELPGAEELRYDGLVIATGVEPRHMPGAPRHDPRVHVLRTLRDAVAVQRNLRAGHGPVVVIGGGFTACELASTVRDLGREVTIVSRSKVLCGRVFGRELGERIGDLHRKHGVKLAMGAEVTHWMPQSWGLGLYLNTGQLIVADCVILAVGSVPTVQWLRGSGLVTEDGVLCRPSCHVQGASDIVAAGDVARWPNLRFEAVPRRVEHWINAVEMGRAAAESLLAGPTEAKPFTPLPRFWTEQHGVRLQAAGMPTLGQDTIRLTGKEGKRGVIGQVRGGRLIGVVGWDSPRSIIRWTAELERELRRPWTSSQPIIPADLADPADETVSISRREPEPEPEPGFVFDDPIDAEAAQLSAEANLRPNNRSNGTSGYFEALSEQLAEAERNGGPGVPFGPPPTARSAEPTGRFAPPTGRGGGSGGFRPARQQQLNEWQASKLERDEIRLN
ncbi:MAG TPA: FAD-dependent oxidoreductase [Pseudonocardiaceae bacterium]|nr:FAD-dependent oxidoreductase [Pseudonocardiaceae bacterium]